MVTVVNITRTLGLSGPDVHPRELTRFTPVLKMSRLWNICPVLISLWPALCGMWRHNPGSHVSYVNIIDLDVLKRKYFMHNNHLKFANNCTQSYDFVRKTKQITVYFNKKYHLRYSRWSARVNVYSHYYLNHLNFVIEMNCTLLTWLSFISTYPSAL